MVLNSDFWASDAYAVSCDRVAQLSVIRVTERFFFSKRKGAKMLKKRNLTIILLSLGLVGLSGFVAYDKLLRAGPQPAQESAQAQYQRQLGELRETLEKASKVLADLDEAHKKSLEEKLVVSDARIEEIVDKKLSAKKDSEDAGK